MRRLTNGGKHKNTDFGNEMNAASGSMAHILYVLERIVGKKVILDSLYIYIYIVMFCVAVEVFIGPSSFHGAEKRKENKTTINKR